MQSTLQPPDVVARELRGGWRRRNRHGRHRRLEGRRFRIVFGTRGERRLQQSKQRSRGFVGRQLLGLFRRFFLLRKDRRLCRARLPHGLHEFWTLLAQDALDAADRVALAVQQMLDAAQKVDVVRPVVAAPAGASSA